MSTTSLTRFFLLSLLVLPVLSRKKKTELDPFPRIITVSKSENRSTIRVKAEEALSGPQISLGNICTEGIQIALDALQNSSILPHYELEVDIEDSMCEVAQSVDKAIRHIRNAGQSDPAVNILPVIIPSSCEGVEYYGAHLKYFNYIGIASNPASPRVYFERKRYSSVFGLKPVLMVYYDALPAFLNSNGWRNIYLLTESSFPLWLMTEQYISQYFEPYNLSWAGTVDLKYPVTAVPAEQEYDDALLKLKNMNGRIVLSNVAFQSLLACRIYKAGMYGPGYVYLAVGALSFLPNSQDKYPGCTAEMLAEVSKSIIYVSWGTPMNLQVPGATDIVGMTGSQLEEKLKERIDHPENLVGWIEGRSTCYAITIAVGALLDDVDKILRKSGDNLLNWTTTSPNFQKNGSYIMQLMTNHLENMHYEGLETFSHVPLNSLVGVASFYQILSRSFSKRDAMAEMVTIAWYDTSLSDPKVQFLKKNVNWRTADGQPPLDSLHTTYIEEALVKWNIQVALQTLSGIMLCVNVVFIIVNTYYRNLALTSRSLPVYNTMIFVGTMCLNIASSLWPYGDSARHGPGKCTAASLFVTLAVSLINAAILGKLIIARKVLLGERKSGSKQSKRIRQRHQRTRERTNDTILVSAVVTLKPQDVEKRPVLKIFFVIIWSIFQTILLGTRFILDPVQSRIIYQRYEMSEDNISIGKQFYSVGCYLSFSSKVSLGFLGIITSCYLLVVLFIISLSASLGKAQLSEINDIKSIRTASWATSTIVAAGAVIIALVFADSSSSVIIAVSVVSLILNAVVIVLIFLPKLMGRYYF